MPQASNELREKMGQYFGDEIDDSGPSEHLLKDAKFKEFRWEYYRPTKDYVLTEKDRDCLQFLIDEWDHGGTVGYVDPKGVLIREHG